MISDVIYWADRLSLVRTLPSEEWALDPLVKRILVGVNEHELVGVAGTA